MSDRHITAPMAPGKLRMGQRWPQGPWTQQLKERPTSSTVPWVLRKAHLSHLLKGSRGPVRGICLRARHR